MAWNRPTEDGRANTPGSPHIGQPKAALRSKVARAVRGGTPRPTIAAIAVTIVVVGAAVAAWWFWPDASAPVAEDGDGTVGRRIREVKPAAARTNETAATTPTGPKELPPQKIGEVRNGMMLLPNGKMHKVWGVVTSDVSNAKCDYAIFDHRSENVIAGLLTHEAGDWLVGTPEYNGEITKDFIESLKTPIIAMSKDDDYTKSLKRLVNEAKIELKAAYDRGEDIEQILLDSRKEFQRLARYKDELKTMTLQGINSASTPEEVEDFITAANKMLEEKGIAPLDDLGPLAKIKLRMDGSQEMEEE